MVSRRFLRIVFFLGLAHVGCTAVGLWWLHRNTCTSINNGMEQQLWEDLQAAGREAIAALSPAHPTTADPHSEAATGAGWGAAVGTIGFLRVDAQWRLIGPADGPERTEIRWSPFSEGDQSGNEGRRGLIVLPAGRHWAVAFPTPDATGYVVAHVHQSLTADRAGRLTESLSSIALLTLLWTCVPVGIVIYMIVRHCHETMDHERRLAQADAMRQTYELVRTRDAIIVGLAKLAESRDPETGDHLERLAAYSSLLAAALSEHPRFREQITPTFIKLIGSSSVLHDIGKVGVPDSILLKKGPLSESERALMQHHSGVGGRCLREIERRMGSSSYLQMAREIALWHHERWDGKGYPDGLSGEDIPLAARIVALADVFDALSTRRSYKEPFPHDQCVKIIQEDRGRHFDPDIVDVWLTIEEQYKEIARRYAPVEKPAPVVVREGELEPDREPEGACAGSRE